VLSKIRNFSQVNSSPREKRLKVAESSEKDSCEVEGLVVSPSEENTVMVGLAPSSVEGFKASSFLSDVTSCGEGALCWLLSSFSVSLFSSSSGSSSSPF